MVERAGSITIPKHYIFKTDSFPYMNLASGKQYGFIAQQVDTVLPDLVNEIVQPQIRDSAGSILQDTMSFKALNYTSLIPIAIRGIQELDSISNTKLTACANPTDSNYLTKWSSVNQQLCNSLIYDDGNKIGIPFTDTSAYVNVFDTVNTNAGKFTGNAAGVYGIATGSNTMQAGLVGQSENASEINLGVMGVSSSATAQVNAGVFGTAENSDNVNIGVAANAVYTSSSAYNIGVIATAEGSANQNVAGNFVAADSVGDNYAIYAEAPSAAAGIHYAGYFNGDVHATGRVTWTSDAQLKTNIADVNSSNALHKLLQLTPKTYEYKTASYPYLSLPRGNQYGLLAQEVEQVFPELVSKEVHPETKDLRGNTTSPRLEYKGLNYTALIPILVGAVKQQQTKIDSLNEVIANRLDAIEQRINICCGNDHRELKGSSGSGSSSEEQRANHINVELSNMQVVVLEQNVPNPFAEQTSISYFIPEGTQNAKIVFTDLTGKEIKTVELQSGSGLMTVFASNLSSGQYQYSLIINGKVYETKKMVKGK